MGETDSAVSTVNTEYNVLHSSIPELVDSINLQALG